MSYFQKNIPVLFLLMLIFGMLGSCSDIVDSDRNKIIEYIGKTDTVKEKSIYFRFGIYSLNYEIDDSTVVWNITKASAFGRTFNVVNKMQTGTYEITSVRMEKSDYFTAESLLPLPYILEPNTIDTKQQFLVTLKTENLNKGIYIDKFIINNNPELGFYFRVEVK